MSDGREASACWSYDSASRKLSVVLRALVCGGFVGSSVETHTVFSWSFNSTLGVLFCGLGATCVVRRRIVGGKKDEEEEEEERDVSFDAEFEGGGGLKRFAHHELRLATTVFAEAGKLGEGGFGGVVKGFLQESGAEIAVKRQISKASKQGQKDYVSEVKIISRLRQRNLVQLIGWCHKRGEFLLVYEYLPNGSLASHLSGGEFAMPRTVRHNVALGLASAMPYLHEEWEQCAVHRDNFNAKLGDFGLARLVDHEYSLHTVPFADTMGYFAPACLETGKSSKESDVYSFGVVALEICCGRRPAVANADEPDKGQLLEAVDKRLMEFDVKEMECLMIVGLWCCHPDPNFQPSIRLVINVLKFEAQLPSDLPKELPKPIYCVNPLSIINLNSYTSSVATGSSIASSASNTESSSKPLLKLAQVD